MALKLQRYAENLEALVESRTEELLRAQTQAETLLLNILPAQIVERLKTKHFRGEDDQDVTGGRLAGVGARMSVDMRSIGEHSLSSQVRLWLFFWAFVPCACPLA